MLFNFCYCLSNGVTIYFEWILKRRTFMYCMQVEIKDETSLKVTTNRGEKEFEFDSVFSATSTQVSQYRSSLFPVFYFTIFPPPPPPPLNQGCCVRRHKAPGGVLLRWLQRMCVCIRPDGIRSDPLLSKYLTL